MRTRLRRGQWIKVETGVLRVEGAPITWESKLLAHVLAAGDGAMASHRSAAALWNLDGFRRVSKPELTVPRDRRIRRTSAVVHHSTDLHLVKPVWRDRIPTTPIGRTLIDLGALYRGTKVLLAVDDARRRNLVTWDQLLDLLVSHSRRGRAGAATLRSILDEHSAEIARTDSGFERLVLLLLRDAGLPAPALQHEVYIDGRTYRIDLAYVAERIAVELNGQIHRERRVWENDQVRYTALTNAGWRVLPFSWHRYSTDQRSIVRQVRLALQTRQDRGG